MSEELPKRKIKLIDRRFQYRLMLRFILVNVLVLVLFGGFIYLFFESEVSANLASAHAAYRSVSQMLFPVVLTLSLLNILITSILMAFLVVYSSHKIAGPLYRFNEALKEISGGNLKPLTRVRDGDQLGCLAQSLGQAVRRLGGDMAAIKEQLDRIKVAHSKDIGSQELREKLCEIEKVVGAYRV